MFVVTFDADDFQRDLRADSRAEWRWEVGGGSATMTESRTHDARCPRNLGE
jgi:hypothetical protein